MVVDAVLRRRTLLGSCVVLAGLACLQPKPAGDNTPSSAPATEPAPAPQAPTLQTVPAPATPPAAEKADAPASGAGNAARAVGVAAPREVPASRPESKSRKRSGAPSKSATDRFDGELESAPEPAPAELRRQLDRAYRASSPDCPSARDRKKAVCDLATQICALTDRDPNVASVAEYCDDARRRCNDAERRTSERCPE
jgi:hypothetical protein